MAKNAAVTDPYNVVEFIKRQMGNATTFFSTASGNTGLKTFPLVIKKMVQDAEAILGETISDAVITVPAYFDDVRRQATLNAAKIAGIDVLRIINEPTAAALAYGLGNDVSNQRIIVYDLGGGTFDVTIMDVSGGEIKVIATDGDHMLGGNDFDDQVMILVNEAFKKEHGVDLLDNLETQMDLRQKAEAAKKTLSTVGSAKITVSAAGKRLVYEITRDEFEEATGHLLQRTRLLVESVLANAKASWKDIDTILLVGGPQECLWSEMLESMSGKVPDSAIILTRLLQLAAMQAGIIMGQRGDARILQTAEGRRLAKTKVTDVTSHSFGIILADVMTRELYNQIMIAKNTPIPARVVDRFYTVSHMQEAVDFVVLQGEDRDPENCVAIGETRLVFERPCGKATRWK